MSDDRRLLDSALDSALEEQDIESGVYDSRRKPSVSFDVDESLVTDSTSSFAEIRTTPRKTRTKAGARRTKVGLRKSSRVTTKLIFALVLPASILFVIFLAISSSANKPGSSRNSSPVAAPTGLVYASGFDMRQNWGSISPYFDTGTPFEGVNPAKSTVRRSHCKLKQSHILHRHADRYPTAGMSKRMKSTVEKLGSMSKPPSSEELSWITQWKYTLGSDLLTSRGVGTEFKSGADFWASHGAELYNATADGMLFYSDDLNKFENGTKRPLPVLRATTQSRIQTSARAWAAGFFGIYGGQPYDVDHDDKGDGTSVYDLVLQWEDAGANNNTLASYYACPRDNDPTTQTGSIKKQTWVDIYLKEAAIRLQRVLPGFDNVTATNAYDMQNLCVFETASYGSSRFCELFTELEWRGFEYAGDLSFYYDSGFGTEVGAAMGAGYLTELGARLENKLVVNTDRGVNLTLDTNPETFPLEQPFYLDMTHDSIIISVLTAMGLGFLNHDLPDDKLLAPRQFVASRLVPFGARLVFDVLDCGEGTESEMFIRGTLNDRVLPLSSLPSCPSSEDGFCGYNDFVKSINKRLEEVDFVNVCYKDIGA